MGIYTNIKMKSSAGIIKRYGAYLFLNTIIIPSKKAIG